MLINHPMHIIALLFLAAIAAAQLNPLAGIGYMGVTIDPLTFAKGQNIFNTSQICLTPDGKWEIVCGMSANPVLQTNIDIVTKSQSSASDFSRDATSDVSISASAGWGIFKATGSYSETSTSMIEIMTSSDSSLVVSRVDMQLYQLNSNKITMPLSAELIRYITIMGAKIAAGDVIGYTQWMAEFLDNFPPGVIDSGISGARLEQMNYVANSYYHSTDTETVQNCASASVSFGSIFSANGHDNWGVTKSQVDTFTSNVQQYTVNSVGGIMEAGMNVSQWQDSAIANPALLSYTMDVSLFWLSPEVLSAYVDLPESTIMQIRNDYIASYARYLEENTYYGCTDPYGSNFKLSYNVDNGSCNYNYSTKSYFGGVYSTTTIYSPNGQQQSQSVSNNIVTGSASCPTGMWAHCSSYTYPFGPRVPWKGGYLSAKATINTCSCDGDTRYPPTGPAFGGFYMQNTANPITEAFSCPPSFEQVGQWCLSDAAPSGIYYGIYQIYNDECNVVNAYTGDCSCPDNSIGPVELATASYSDPYGTSWTYESYICLGPPPFTIGGDIGIPPILGGINPITNMTTNTTAPPRHHTGNNAKTILIVVSAIIGGFVVIATGFAFVKWRKYDQNSYDPVL